MLENHGTGSVIGNARLPALNRLAAQGAVALNNHGVTHPSLPNYVALLAGSNFGSHSDDPNQKFNAPNLADRLEAAGLSWKGYFQGLPRAGFTGNYAGPFWVYVKRHNPFMLFPSVAQNPARAANVVPLDQLERDLQAGKAPTFALIVPDLCHDLHRNVNCMDQARLAANADTFVAKWVNAIRSSPAWDDQAAIVITFDEAEGSDKRVGGGRIPAIVLTRSGPQGYSTETNYNHYSLLRTLTDAWNLAPLGESAQAAPMNEVFFK